MEKNKFFHSVFLVEDHCKGCVNCLKRCPTKAIRIRNGKAHIIHKFCIDCGECIRHCPHHAKQSRRDHIEVLKDYKYTVALPAPALYSQYNNISDINIILTGLLHLGFDDVFEVSGGAELVSQATRAYVKNHEEQWPLISTACPTIERLIRVRFPSLIDHMLPLLPPMEVAASLARQKAVHDTGYKPEEIGIIFISPCPSKVSFTKEPLGMEKSNVDHVLAIKDIYPALLSKLTEAEANPRDLSISGKIGVGWGVSGGEAAGIFTYQYLAADGIENVIRVLEDLEDDKLSSKLKFIELNACSGGCVGGVLNIENPYIAIAKNKELNKYMPISGSHEEDYLPNYDVQLDWTKPIEYESVYQIGENMLESMANLSAVEELLEELPGLDCGACGAPTCKCLAEDVIRGKADKDDCIYLLRDRYDALLKSQLFKEKGEHKS